MIGDDGGVGNEQRRNVAAEQAQASKCAGREEVVLIVEDGPAADRAGAPIDLIIEEVHDAAARPFRLIGKPHGNGVFQLARHSLAPFRRARVANIVGLRGVENEMNRFERHDCRQQGRSRLSALNEISRIDATVRYAPRDRCANLGPLKIKLGVSERGFGAQDLRLGDLTARFSLIDVAHGNGPALRHFLRAPVVTSRHRSLRLRPDEFRARAVDRDLKRPLIDDEQDVAGFDELSVGEIDLFQSAGNARADFDLL